MVKTKTRIIFSLIFIFIVFYNQFSASSLNNYSKIDINDNSIVEGIKNDYLDIIMTIANNLLIYAEHDEISGLKWSKYPTYIGKNPFYSSKYFYGLHYGAAGIGEFLLKIYSISNNQSYLLSACSAADYIIAHGITDGKYYNRIFNENGYIFWNKSEDFASFYSGIKYGNAGMSKFFLNLYKQTLNITYLEIAKKSLNTLKLTFNKESNAEEGIHGINWGYSLNGTTPITDIIYGNAGIGSIFLYAYELTQEPSYLEFASKSMQWIISQSEITKNTSDGLRFVRYSPDPSYPFAFTGFLTGNSGIGSIFLDFYDSTSNEDYLLFATQIGNWLLKEEHNGLWKFGGADLLTENINEEGNYLGFGAGSAGIGIFLMKLYDKTKNSLYLESIKRIEFMFEKNGKIDQDKIFWTVQESGIENKTILTDLKLGNAGIGLFYSNLYNLFGTNESIIKLKQIANFYRSITSENNLIPMRIDTQLDNDPLYDFSLLEGQSGIGYTFQDIVNNLNSTVKYNNNLYYSIKINTGLSFFNQQSIELFIFTMTVVLIKKNKNKRN